MWPTMQVGWTQYWPEDWAAEAPTKSYLEVDLMCGAEKTGRELRARAARDCDNGRKKIRA